MLNNHFLKSFVKYLKSTIKTIMIDRKKYSDLYEEISDALFLYQSLPDKPDYDDLFEAADVLFDKLKKVKDTIDAEDA